MIGVRAIGWCGIISFLAQFRGNAETFLAYRTPPMEGGEVKGGGERSKSDRGKFFYVFCVAILYVWGGEYFPHS